MRTGRRWPARRSRPGPARTTACGSPGSCATSPPGPSGATASSPSTAPRKRACLPRRPTTARGSCWRSCRTGSSASHVDGTHFTTYNFGSDVVRPYFFPLIGPTGSQVVRSWPMVEGVVGETNDHPHHKGLYVAHGDVNGTDNWSEGPDHCTMRHAGFARLVSGPVYGSFDETVEWLDREARIVLTETRRVTFFNLGPDERVLDVSLRFNAGSGQVTFGDTKEGGLISIRVASSMDGPTRRRPGRGGPDRELLRRAPGGGDLGQAGHVVRLLRPAGRRDGGGLPDGLPHQSALPHPLARPRLRPDDRQPLRPARLLQRQRHPPRGLDDPGLRVAQLPLPRPPPPRLHRRRAGAGAVPRLRQHPLRGAGLHARAGAGRRHRGRDREAEPPRQAGEGPR